MQNPTHALDLQHYIHRVAPYASVTELLHVPLDKFDVGLLIVKLLLVVLNVLTRRRDLKRSESISRKRI